MAVFIAGERTVSSRGQNSVIDAAFQNGGASDGKVMHRVIKGDQSTVDAGTRRGDDVSAGGFAVQQGGEDVVLCNRIGVLRDLDRLIAGGIVHGATHVNVLVLDLRRGCGVRGRETGGAVSVCPNNCAGRS